MKKKKIYIFPLLIMGLFSLFTSSCKKNEDKAEPKLPILSTTEITKIYQFTAHGGGAISSDGGAAIIARGICWNTTGNPTVEDNKTACELCSDNFTSKLTGLTVGTTYYARAYATNSQGTAYGNTITFETLGNTFTDSRDNNVYKMITIGDQIWMAENLAYLPSVNMVADGSEDAAGSYYYVYGYNGTYVTDAKATSNYDTYGVLYNWTAAMDGESGSTTNPSGIQGVCPSGWHLPSEAEWKKLTDYLGGLGVADDKLKEVGTAHWIIPNTSVTNETGFTALPGGARRIYGEVYDVGNLGYIGYWWSATKFDASNAFFLYMFSDDSNVAKGSSSEEVGLSVRCLRD